MLGHFHFLTVMNNVAMNVHVQAFFNVHIISFLLHIYLGGELLGYLSHLGLIGTCIQERPS